MGLEEYDEGNGIFLKIKHGCICTESKVEREGYKKVEGALQDGTPWKKWIRPYKAVSGYVDKMERYDREFEGRKFRGWSITINDAGNIYFLDIPFTSRVNSRWMKLAESIDYTKPVRFSAWHDRKTDSTAFNVQQDGVSVPQKYTREDPGNMPEPIQRASGKWDYGAQEDFLVERLLKFVIPNVELIAANRNAGKATEKSDDSSPDSSQGNGLENDYGVDEGGPMRDIQRSVKALAGTRIVNGAAEGEILKDYFGTDKWNEVELLPEGLLKAQAAKLDSLIPF